jgi:hypothetical protein
VAAILTAPWGSLDLPGDGQEIILPVNLPTLSKIELVL